MKVRTKTSVYLEIIAWILATVLLVGAILYFNVYQKDSTVESGYEIGNECPDFELELYASETNPDGGMFKLSDSRGKIVVLNFWYTSCGPCLAELPHFNQVQEEYGDVKIYAIHSYAVDTSTDKQAFVNDKFGGYSLSFAQDTEELKLFNKLGGKNAYPHTVILDKNGVIRFIKTGSVSLEELKTQIDAVR